jgi:hypothetical protein
LQASTAHTTGSEKCAQDVVYNLIQATCHKTIEKQVAAAKPCLVILDTDGY